jgi:hypothetical protein
MPRFLCSQLVTLSWEEGATVVNLEEIEERGCLLESEAALPVGEAVEIRCGRVFLAGKITKAEEHGFGWRVEVEFSPLTPWSIERFRPGHLFDPASVAEST